MKKQKISLFIAAALLISFAASCGETGNDKDHTDDTSAASDSTTEAEDTSVKDDLGSFDFGGNGFNVMTRTTPLFYPYLDQKEETGDVLDDAVYKRNRNVEERFNFVLNEQYYDYAVEGNDYPRKFLLAGDDTYDMFIGRCVHMFNYAAEGMIVPVEDIPHLNFDKPYWNDQLYGDLEIQGTHYFAVGDFNISALDFTHALLFNKGMAEDYQVGSLYDMVRQGKWTYDKFAEVARLAVNDLDGNTEMDELDQYGYTSLVKQVMPGFWIASGVVTITKDADGALVYTAPTNEKLIEVFQKIYDITWDDNIWHRNVETYAPATSDAELELFKNGQAMFTNASCFQITTMMRDSETEFGILPYPKYDEAQEKYYSRIEGAELFGIPKTNTDLEMTGVILEALACASHNEVIPAYYDVALKVKYTRDEESAEMLDIVFENRVFDFGDTIFADQLRDGIIRKSFETDNRDIVSALTGVESTVNGKLTPVNEGFAELSK